MATTSPMTLLFQDAPVLLPHTLSFLSGTDTLKVSCVCRGLHQEANKYSDIIFRRHLTTDFPEGKLLVELFEEDATRSFRSMYLAFLHRWNCNRNVQKQVQGKRYLAIPWQRPANTSRSYDHAENNSIKDDNTGEEAEEMVDEDVASLKFIVRMGDDSDSCGKLGWKGADKEHGEERPEIDEEWENEKNCEGIFFELPFLDNDLRTKIDLFNACTNADEGCDHAKYEEIEESMYSTYRLSLHAVDTQTCQVLTLVENAAPDDNGGIFGEFLTFFHYRLPTFLGVPHRSSSPFHISNLNFCHHDESWEDDTGNKIESLDFMTSLRLARLSYDDFIPDGDDEPVYLVDDKVCLQTYIYGSTLRDRRLICSYFRALMKEKCVRLETAASEASFVDAKEPASPPAWVQTKKVIDCILSFAAFEDLATTLRLVCKSFKASALAQIEKKLLDQDWLPIAFYRNPGDWFRCDARRVRTENNFSRREGVVEEALSMTTCRGRGSCKEESCSSEVNPPTYRCGWKGPIKTLDLTAARRLLSEKGYIYLTPNFPGGQKRSYPKPWNDAVKLAFRIETKMNLYQVAQDVYRKIKKNVQDFTESYMYQFVPSVMTEHWDIRMERMKYKRFLRSLFLVFTDGTSIENGHFPTVTVATASCKLQDEHGTTRFLTKTVFQFPTARNEQIEICLERRGIYH